MTICYGSRKGGISVDKVTRKMKTFGWTEQLMTDIIDGNEHNFENPMKSAVYLANHLDTVLRKIAPKPMEVMDWLQKVAGTLAKFGHPVYWVTPMNFPVINAYYKSKEAQLVTYERGKRVRVRYNYGSTGELITSKQKNGMSPNFVHSCDAAHLQLTALNAKEAGINSVLMIHDSFSCLPADMEKFHKITTDSFVEMYENWDAIQELYLTAVRTIGVENAHLIPEPPKYGDLDLRMVRDSKYAFA
jgi:DNA-directed RNA polymerase